MSQSFKLRFDEMRENSPVKTEKPTEPDNDTGLYHASGYGRNLCLVWPDGRRFFLNYAYLISGEYNPGDPLNEIILTFSSHTAILKGYNLQLLYMELLDHLPRVVEAVETRYVSGTELNESIVTEIITAALE